MLTSFKRVFAACKNQKEGDIAKMKFCILQQPIKYYIVVFFIYLLLLLLL